MYLTKSQRRVVDKIFKLYLERTKEKHALLKAPTGSGKTFMSSELISKILFHSMSSNVKTIVVVATISNAELPKQFAFKLKEYKGFHEFNEYNINYIESPSNSKSSKVEDISDFELKENSVYVFGKSSFGKNTLFYQNGTLDTFIQRAKIENIEIIYIRDEAHIGSGKKASEKDANNFDKKMIENSSFILEMTATPNTKNNLVEMKREDLESDGRFLLKNREEKSSLVGDNITNDELIDDAITTYKNVKKEYAKLDENINPAMLIQVDSDSNKDLNRHELFKDALEVLKKKLTEAGLVFMIYFEDHKKVYNTIASATLEYASQKNSIIDAIIFKVGPATGWDIPRANMLLQLRNISSENLKMQTLGRVMRNPLKNLEKNEITDKYYLFSNFQKPTRDDVTYVLKDHFKNKKLKVGKVNENSKKFKEDNFKFIKGIKKLLFSSDFVNFVKEINENEIIYDELKYGKAVIPNHIENYFKLKAFNYRKCKEHLDIINLDYYQKEIQELIKETNKNIEIIKYCIWQFIPEIKEIKNLATEWIHNEEPYVVDDSDSLMKKYNIWKDNDNKKNVKSEEDFGDKYGYMLVSNGEDIQWLDSKPEMAFYKKINEILTDEIKSEIKFFAKMPTLGSKVYFEYYCKSESKIKKSFMDFAIEFKDKIIMVEVKSKDQDYDESKTEDLINAYKMYMESNSKNNLSLLLYQHDDKKPKLSAFINGEWNETSTFSEVFLELLK